MAPHPAAIGSTRVRGPRQVHRSRGAARKILQDWGFIPTGLGRGRQTAASCTTAPHAIWRASLGTRRGGKSGGTRAAQKWVGNDVPDFKPDSHPKDHLGPFIMNPEGVGRIFVPLGAMADGPFPEHYEPFESPIQNPLHPNQSNNPVVKKTNDGRRQVWNTRAGIYGRLYHIPLDRAVSLLDEKQSDERPADSRGLC